MLLTAYSALLFLVFCLLGEMGRCFSFLGISALWLITPVLFPGASSYHLKQGYYSNLEEY